MPHFSAMSTVASEGDPDDACDRCVHDMCVCGRAVCIAHVERADLRPCSCQVCAWHRRGAAEIAAMRKPTL